MVMAGMLLSDWVSFVICWCGHMAVKHSLHKDGDGMPVYSSCSMCEECKQFYPETKEDREKLREALGVVHEAIEVREWASAALADSKPIMLKTMDRTKASALQVTPKGTGRAITPLVIADLEERREHGMAKYGEELIAFNGRDAMQDAYQEALDLVMYFRQMLEEYDQNLLESQRALEEQKE